MKRINNLKKIYSTIDFMTAEDKFSNLPSFPKIIEFELTNYCNYKCIMCSTGLGTCKREQGYMPDDIFELVCDEIRKQNNNIAVKFVGLGEPLLHPKALLYIKKMKELGVIVHLTTNGSRLTDEVMEQLIDAEIDSIKFSFQGVDSIGYKTFRQKDAFNEYLNTIKRFSELRGEKLLPYMTIGTSIADETEEQIEQFKHLCENIVDNVEVGITQFKYINPDAINDETVKNKVKNLAAKQEAFYKRYKCCPQIFDTITVRWNGDVTSCCGDYEGKMTLGNLKEMSIQDCWNSGKQNKYREILMNGRYDMIDHCKDCYDVYGWTYGAN